MKHYLLLYLFTGLIFIIVSGQEIGVGNYPYWGEYQKTPVSEIKKAAWISKDTVINGWDWSLPGFVEPSPVSKLCIIRNFSLESNKINQLPEVNFPANPVISHWVKWRELEPTEGNINFQPLIDNIKKASQKGYGSIVRIHFSAIDFAPDWIKQYNIPIREEKKENPKKTNYEVSHPEFHKRYLKFIKALGESGITHMEEVKGLFLGYASPSNGDEGIGPYGEGNPEANDTVQHVIERIDAWAEACKGVEYKVYMGGLSNYGFSKGFGIRRGFVEMYLYHIPDEHIGQKLDNNNFLYVDETSPVIAKNVFQGEENEEYEEKWADGGSISRFGALESFPYRYFTANLRLLQMRVNYLLNNEFALLPEMLSWVSLEMGRTIEDAPDAWCFLRESYIKENGGSPVKNFERWLYQRDAPGYLTEPAVRIDHAIQMWMVQSGKYYDYVARQGKKIGFDIDDRWAGLKDSIAIKISYIDNHPGELNLVYNNGQEQISKPLTLLGDNSLKTATFFISKIIANSLDQNFDFVLEAGKNTDNITVSFVRVVHADETTGQLGAVRKVIPENAKGEFYPFYRGLDASGTQTFPKTVNIYYNKSIPQIDFAAKDIKAALEQRNFIVEIKNITSYHADFKGKKVIIALSNDKAITELLKDEGGCGFNDLEEQAYALRTTTNPDLSYWVFGGDNNGAMYGALQVAEKINASGFQGNYNESNAPFVKKRGIKFNIPLDKIAPTYEYSNGGTSHQNAIEHVWDMSFWQDYFDEMARYRFNVLSLWNPHPFTSMLNMEDEYPGIAIQDVQGYDGFSKIMTIDEKVKFWQEFMAYGKSRGFEIHFCTWNIFLWNAAGKYGLTDDYDADQTATKAYLKKCMVKFLETYPDLDGFGVTAGENLKYDNNADKTDWTWAAYGEGFKEHALANPGRELIFFHRQHQGDVTDIIEKFSPLYRLDNVTLDVSYKYAKAHVHSTASPDHWSNQFLEQIEEKGVKTWLELRNDDFYFLHWGDHQFVRDFVNAMPEDKLLAGTFFGSDGWVFTRVFTSKNPYFKNNNALEVQKHWYLNKLWGRLQYDPNTPVSALKADIKHKYPEVPEDVLFEAWTSSSRAMQIANEQVGGSGAPAQSNISRYLDFQWWPEFYTRYNGFITLEKTQYAGPMPGSNLCSIYETAENNCGGKVSAFVAADSIESKAKRALWLLESIHGEDTELLLLKDELKAMSNLSLYNAYKNRAAIYLKQGKNSKSLEAIGTAYCYWEKYTTIMDSLYYPVDTQRNWDFADSDWHDMDDEALKDYTSFGRNRKPNCSCQYPWIDFISPFDNSTHLNSTNLKVELVVESGNRSVEKVELFRNGALIGSDSDFPYSFILKKPTPGEYTLEAVVYDNLGNTDASSINVNVFNAQSYNSVPWIENFQLERRTTNDNGVTSWSSERVNGRFYVVDGKLTLNDNGTEGVMKTGKIDISGGVVDISMEVESSGDLEEDDYARFYKIVDGGREELIGEIKGPVTNTNILTGEAKGKTLQLVIRSDVNASTRYYHFDNLRVYFK